MLVQGQGYWRRPKAREPLPDTTPNMAAIQGRQFSVGYSQGWLAYLVHVSVKMACKILRLSDELKHTWMHENQEKVVALISKRLLFRSERLSHHYRIQHSWDHVCGDEEMKRRKNVLGKLKASETLNNIAIQSLKRQEQVRFLRFACLANWTIFFVKSKLKSQIELNLSMHLFEGK